MLEYGLHDGHKNMHAYLNQKSIFSHSRNKLTSTFIFTVYAFLFYFSSSFRLWRYFREYIVRKWFYDEHWLLNMQTQLFLYCLVRWAGGFVDVFAFVLEPYVSTVSIERHSQRQRRKKYTQWTQLWTTLEFILCLFFSLSFYFFRIFFVVVSVVVAHFAKRKIRWAQISHMDVWFQCVSVCAHRVYYLLLSLSTVRSVCIAGPRKENHHEQWLLIERLQLPRIRCGVVFLWRMTRYTYHFVLFTSSLHYNRYLPCCALFILFLYIFFVFYSFICEFRILDEYTRTMRSAGPRAIYFEPKSRHSSHVVHSTV